LPTPPGPVTVTSRCSFSRPATWRTGPSRPTKLVSATGKPCTPPATAASDAPTPYHNVGRRRRTAQPDQVTAIPRQRNAMTRSPPAGRPAPPRAAAATEDPPACPATPSRTKGRHASQAVAKDARNR